MLDLNYWDIDVLLNVFLAIAVDNLADAENLTQIDKEEKQKKKKERLTKLALKESALPERPSIEYYDPCVYVA